MALRDEDQRMLAEIERGLIADDPRLASRFAERPKPSAGTVAGTIAGIVMMLLAGSVIITVGVQLGAPILIVVGGIVATVVPVMVASRR